MQGCPRRNVLKSDPARPAIAAPAAGIACGAGAALFWPAGFVAARHGIAVGFSPADIVLHRFVWAGLVFLPFVAWQGFGDLGGVGWMKAVALTLLGGPPFAFLSYAGFLFVPLAHGGVIQPSCAALGGLALATRLRRRRRDVSLHPLRRAARRRPRRGISRAGPGYHASDRLPRARRGAEPRPARGLWHRARRIPADAKELIGNPPHWLASLVLGR